MQLTRSSAVSAVLAFSPAVLAVPQAYGTGIISHEYTTTSSSQPPMNTGIEGWHQSYPIGTGGTADTTFHYSTTTGLVYKPTVTYAQTSRIKDEPAPSGSAYQMYPETQPGPDSKPTDQSGPSGPSSKPTDSETFGGLPGLSKTQQILLSDT